MHKTAFDPLRPDDHPDATTGAQRLQAFGVRNSRQPVAPAPVRLKDGIPDACTLFGALVAEF